ncbi:phage tail protein [Paenibacillus alvei]|uniref:phage tail protein n=1 Tax=Paenibacillus alvei TaxID=44250 RepID=UPI00227E9978|nr:phage tail protein [Paenibacillus alvei]MCY7486053.1 phage tail protein [Paenibacillus alvei]
MAEQTPNLGLAIQGQNDNYDIDIHNENYRKIDTAISNIKVTPEEIGAAKKADFDAHVQDTTKHVTVAERNTWNAKETPDGAQAKANTAETNAKNASLPRTGGTVTGDLSVSNTLYVASRNVLWEIDQAKQSGADAKNRIAGAVNAKGVPASANDDFPTLAWKIGQIVTGVPFARINTNVSENFQSFKPYEDATVSSGLSYVMVTGLSFTAKGIMVLDKRGKAMSSFDSETSKSMYVSGSINFYQVVYRDTLPKLGGEDILATITPTSFIAPVSYYDDDRGVPASVIVYG